MSQLATEEWHDFMSIDQVLETLDELGPE